MLYTWKIKIQGNSMEGLFPDGKELRVTVNSDLIADDLEIGEIVILKKHSLIIHRIVGKFWGQNQFYFWEKGDNDCYPKLCIKENILGIVTGIEDYPDFRVKHQPSLWRQKNTKLLKFYKIANKIYALIMGGNMGIGTNERMGGNVGMGRNMNQRHGLIKKLRRKGFWSLLYLICSLLDLKGK